MAVSFGASVLARAALTMWKVPIHQSPSTALVYNCVDMVVCVIISRYVLQTYQKEFEPIEKGNALPIGISLARIAGLVAGVAATALLCRNRIDFWNAVIINMGTGCAGILVVLIPVYLYGKVPEFPTQF